jgi:hypothetical protein
MSQTLTLQGLWLYMQLKKEGWIRVEDFPTYGYRLRMECQRYEYWLCKQQIRKQ